LFCFRSGTGRVGRRAPMGTTGQLSTTWIQCPQCRAAIRHRALASGEFLDCGRCGTTVEGPFQARRMALAMAFAWTGLVAMVPANLFPVLIFNVAGNTQENLVVTGVLSLWQQGYEPLAVLVGFSAIASPALYLGGVAVSATICHLRLKTQFAEFFLRVAEIFESWCLLPVFAVACLVSVVKLRTLGSVSWEPGSVWILVSALATFLAMRFFDFRQARERLEALG